MNPVDRERERAAVGHCIARVEREIEQDLVDLGRVGDDRGRIVAHPKVGSDRGRQNSAKERGGATQQTSRLDFLESEFVLAAEGEQLPGEGSRSAACLDDDVRALLDLVLALRQPDQLCMAIDGGEEIVEVMRDASREATDRLELLSFLDLSLLVASS